MIKLNLLSLFLLFSIATSAQENKSDSTSVPEPKSFITSYQITNGSKKISYKAIASETYLKNKSNAPVASIWSVANIQEDPIDQKKRPVTFVFNGGPGSGSMWLHMELFRPEIIKVNSDAKEDDGAAPYNLVLNKQQLIDLTDLVFIDTVSTKYSRVIAKGKVEDYWVLNEDAASIAKFTRQWITENKRWFSPKYIAGESLGTTRAVTVANALEENG